MKTLRKPADIANLAKWGSKPYGSRTLYDCFTNEAVFTITPATNSTTGEFQGWQCVAKPAGLAVQSQYVAQDGHPMEMGTGQRPLHLTAVFAAQSAAMYIAPDRQRLYTLGNAPTGGTLFGYLAPQALADMLRASSPFNQHQGEDPEVVAAIFPAGTCASRAVSHDQHPLATAPYAMMLRCTAVADSVSEFLNQYPATEPVAFVGPAYSDSVINRLHDAHTAWQESQSEDRY